MKTLARLMQTAAVAATLGCGGRALADRFGSGPGREFGERPEHGRWQVGSGRGWEGMAPARDWRRPAPSPVAVRPRPFAPRPAYPRLPRPVGPNLGGFAPAAPFWPPPPPPVGPSLGGFAPAAPFWPPPPAGYAQPVPTDACVRGGQPRVMVGPPPPQR